MLSLRREEQFRKIIDLIIRVYENQYQQYKIKFPVILNMNINNSDTLGYLDTKTGKLYINFHAFDKFPATLAGDNQAITILFYTICHEFQHFVQSYDTNISASLTPTEKIMIELERKMLLCDVYPGEDFYQNNHDYYLMENTADYIGVRNARLIAHGLNGFTDKINAEYYLYIEQYASYRRLVYDIPAMIERFNILIKRKPECVQRKNNFLNNDIIYEFFDEQGHYKSVTEIMNNPKLSSVELRKFVAMMLSSNYFIDNLERLLPEELSFVLNCVKETYEDYEHRYLKMMREGTQLNNTFDYIQTYAKSKKRKKIELQVNLSYYRKLEHILKYYGMLNPTSKIR